MQLQTADIVLAVINAKWIHPSLALRLLKANLGELEQRCLILEFALRQNEQDIVDSILNARAKILGLSVSIWNHKATLNLLKNLHDAWRITSEKELRSQAASDYARPFIVLGGPEVSYLPSDSKIFRYADFVIQGEGETAFRELCVQLLSREKNEAITHLRLLQNSSFERASNNNRSFIGHLPEKLQSRGKTNRVLQAAQFIKTKPYDPKKLKSPYYLYTDEDLKRKLIYVESARGCVFNCDYCLGAQEPFTGQTKPEVAFTTGNSSLAKVRDFPLEPFLADMDKLLERLFSHNAPEHNRVKTIKFLDRSFNLNTIRAIEIINFFLHRIKNKYKNLCVHFEMVPFNFTDELRVLLGNFPCGSLRLELGIQTLNQKTASIINRPGNTEEALEIIKYLRENTCAIVHADLIAGLPDEDMASFGKGFDKLWIAMTGGKGSIKNNNKNHSMEIQAGRLKLLPGTPMARHIDSHKMKFSSEPPYEVLETSVIPEAEMNRIKNFARFWEVIVNRDHFHDEIFQIIHPGEPVFSRFMELSDSLLARFGRNWGIDRNELRQALKNAC